MRCEGFPKCKDLLPRKNLFDHCEKCPEIKVYCAGPCKQFIKRKHYKEDHNCLDYLTEQLNKKNVKVKSLKGKLEHAVDIEKAFGDCDPCKESSKLKHLADYKPEAAL